ncbi:MAG TPA: glycosyltransferase family 39 protein [Chloroflexota bacterium]|jgi:4-amino-4-deoxy-L-arabinose transferase-like glycosyltransferase
MLALPDRLRKPVTWLRVPALGLGGWTGWWQYAAALGPLLVAVVLGGYRLDQEGYGNLYYAAGMRSMLTSWHNWFFAAFDPGGFVTLDKPPVGFWVQAASAKLLGFSGLALLLPQALAGVAAVGLLYYLVRRAWGTLAGFLAALFLALTPISVATSRNNTIDSLLVLTVLLAAWAALRATETGRLGWLLAAAALVGLGFNVKMLEAFLVLPALYLLYLACGPGRWPWRVLHLTGASLVLLVVSLSWAVAVDLTPAAARPFVGSSTLNSELELIIWHNGLSRVLPSQALFGAPILPGTEEPAAMPPPTPPADGLRPGAAGFPGGGRAFGAFGIGAPGPLRLVERELGSQIGWLLPLAVLGLAAAAWAVRRSPRASRGQQAVVLWGTWLLTVGAFFSATRQFQPYYLVMLAPAVAAVAGMALAACWQAYRDGGRAGWLLPALLAAGALTQCWLLAAFPDWGERLAPWIVGLALGSVVALAGGRLVGRPPSRSPRWSLAAAAPGLAALLLAPAVWASAPALGGMGPRPLANPDAAEGRFRRDLGGAPNGEADYLLAHQDAVRFLAATQNANTAAPLILATGQPVMAVGGFSGADPILTPEQFAARVAAGDVRYALFPAAGERAGRGPAGGRRGQQPLIEWVQANCAAVPAADWQPAASADDTAPRPARRAGTLPGAGAAGQPGANARGAAGPFTFGGQPTLYDCGAAGAATPSS